MMGNRRADRLQVVEEEEFGCCEPFWEGAPPLPVRPSYTFPIKSIEILVVDDGPKIGRIIASYLQEEGFDTTEASDGETALELASSTPDLAILDAGLPGIDGIEVLRQIRTRSEVPVMLVTAPC
jgi:PleD family two-component response regulator